MRGPGERSDPAALPNIGDAATEWVERGKAVRWDIGFRMMG